MNTKELVDLALEYGFDYAGPLNVSGLQVLQDVRDACAKNTCGQYGRTWGCPPAFGDLEESRKIIEKYKSGIIVQSAGVLGAGVAHILQDLQLGHVQRAGVVKAVFPRQINEFLNCHGFSSHFGYGLYMRSPQTLPGVDGSHSRRKHELYVMVSLPWLYSMPLSLHTWETNRPKADMENTCLSGKRQGRSSG